MARPRTIHLRSERYEALAQRLAKQRRALGYVAESCRIYYLQASELLAWLDEHGVREIEAVKPDDIRAYYTYLSERSSRNDVAGGTISADAIRQHIRVVQDLFGMLAEHGELAVDPTSTVRWEPSGEEVRTERVALTQSQVQRLYEACETARGRAILSLAYGCGLRVSEMVRLNVANVRLGEGVVVVERGKGGKRRTVPLSGGVAEDLAEYIARDRSWWLELGDRSTPALVVGDRGERMQKWTYNKRLRALGERAGLERKLTCHVLRHAIATHLLERGLAMAQVQLFLGHAWLETTQTYTHVSAELLAQLVEDDDDDDEKLSAGDKQKP